MMALDEKPGDHQNYYNSFCRDPEIMYQILQQTIQSFSQYYT